jgi:mannose-1-phosphate guanylyltransferase/phosphomannomutase
MPKPMVPVLGDPVLSYSIQLLKRNGFRNIGMTVMYLPHKIERAFGDGSQDGVSLHYYHEKKPLGTAGSVLLARDALKQTFIILSGDGLTDCDLHSAMQFHKQRGGVATLVLKKTTTPLEYGCVVTDGDGRIRRFIEKPSWGEVCSDSVNTGIYILEPQILDYILEDTNYDFGKDLFPKLVADNIPIYGYQMNGYWCDIGDQSAYVKAQMDFLSGKVGLDTRIKKNADGNFIAESAEISKDATLETPCFIDEGAVITAGASILAGTVIGEKARIDERANVKRCVLWSGAKVGRDAELRGMVMCCGSAVGEGASAFEDSALGDSASLGARARLDPGVKVWPYKRVEPGMRVAQNLVWGDLKRPQADDRGLEPSSPECACTLAAAYAKASGAKEIALMREASATSQALAAAALSGLMGQGVGVMDMGEGTLPMLRRLMRMLSIPAGLYICEDRIVPCAKDGVWPTRTLLRSWETLSFRQDFNQAFTDAPKLPGKMNDGGLFYAGALSAACDGEAIRAFQPRVAVFTNSAEQSSLVKRVFSTVGLEHARIVCLNSEECGANNGNTKDALESWETGFRLSVDGVNVQVFDSINVPDDETQLLINCSALLDQGQKLLIVPMQAPFTLETIAAQKGARVKRVRAAAESWMGALAEAGMETQLDVYFDGVSAMLAVISWMSRRRTQLRGLLEQMPALHRFWETIPCANPDKGRVLKALSEEERFPDLTDGLRVDHGDGFAMLITGTGQPELRVFGESRDAEFARELCDDFSGKVKKILEANKEPSAE